MTQATGIHELNAGAKDPEDDLDGGIRHLNEHCTMVARSRVQMRCGLNILPRLVEVPPPARRATVGGMKTLQSLALISALVAGGILSACSTTPGASPAVPSVSLPAISIDPSAAANAVIGVLDQLETEIAANEGATGLTADEGDALEGIVAKIRTAVETGDLSAATPTVEELKAKVGELDAKLGTDAGTRLKAALAQLEALLAS